LSGVRAKTHRFRVPGTRAPDPGRHGQGGHRVRIEVPTAPPRNGTTGSSSP
jgi:hypothetical protein